MKAITVKTAKQLTDILVVDGNERCLLPITHEQFAVMRGVIHALTGHKEDIKSFYSSYGIRVIRNGESCLGIGASDCIEEYSHENISSVWSDIVSNVSVDVEGKIIPLTDLSNVNSMGDVPFIYDKENDKFTSTNDMVFLDGEWVDSDRIEYTIDGEAFAISEDGDPVSFKYFFSERYDGYINKDNGTYRHAISEINHTYNEDFEYDYFRRSENFETFYVNGNSYMCHESVDLSANDIIHVEDDDNHGECFIYIDDYRTCQNAGYHQLSRKDHRTEKTTWSIGFEVEKEDEDTVTIGYSKLYDKTDWIKESDGSLDSDTGYELVSPIYDLFSNKVDKDIEANRDLATLINADSSDNCGGHINIGHRNFNSKEVMEGISAFFPLLYSMYPHRKNVDYCKSKAKHLYYRDEKYASVYAKNSKVLELRIFSAVSNVENLLWRRDLVRIFVNNFNCSERDVLKMLCNPKSKLHVHLRKVYSAERLMNKINDYISNSREFNNKVLGPVDVDKIKNKIEQSNNNDSTNNQA